MKILSFTEMENVLRFAVRNVGVPRQQIAAAIGLSASGFNKWFQGANHISIENGDKLINWFRNQHLESLEMAVKCFSNSNL